MATLERAIEIACRAHAGQVDKAGAPYILHPLRMMLAVRSPEARMAAMLHDVVEDSTVTLEQLRAEGFPAAVVAAVGEDDALADERQSLIGSAERRDTDVPAGPQRSRRAQRCGTHQGRGRGLRSVHPAGGTECARA